MYWETIMTYNQVMLNYTFLFIKCIIVNMTFFSQVSYFGRIITGHILILKINEANTNRTGGVVFKMSPQSDLKKKPVILTL